MLKMSIGAARVVASFALRMFYPELPGRILFTIIGGLLITRGFREFKAKWSRRPSRRDGTGDHSIV